VIFFVEPIQGKAVIRDEHGQGTVESAVFVIFLIAIIVAFLLICYLSISKYWVQYQLHEANICYGATSQELQCSKQAQKNIEKLLPKTTEKNVEIFKDKRRVFSRYWLRVPFAELMGTQNKILFEESLGL